MTSRRIMLVTGALLIASADAAWSADKTPGKAENRSAEIPTTELIGNAVAEYDGGRFEEARALFRLAHDRAPTARTLRGIGMASFELRDYVEATRALAGSILDQRRPLTDDQRRQVEGLLARAETFVGRFSLHLRPTDASLFVDGKATQVEADGTLLVAFGRHRITARCSSCLPSEKEIEVEVLGGERRELELTLATAGAGAVPGIPTPAPGPSLPLVTDQPNPAGGNGTAALWWGGVAAASAVGAAAGVVWWVDRQHELDACQTAGARCRNESAVADQRNLAVGVTLGLGAAAITTGIVAGILWWRRDAPSSGRVACLGGKGTVSCAIGF